MRSLLPWLGVAVLGLSNGCLFNAKPDSGPGDPTEFPTDVVGLDFAKKPEIIDVKHGDTITLTATAVKKTMQGHAVRMVAFNGSIPGPTLRVQQGSEIFVVFKNQTGFPNALHSHGVRLDNDFDGAQGITQPPVPTGASFTYRIRFPDPGVFWYHAHFRPDYFNEMGMYGNYLVVPAQKDYWKPADREEIVTLDDFFLDLNTGKPPPYQIESPNRTMMGRFGNLWLINGDSSYSLTVKRKELVRFYFTNTSNTRVFNIGLEPENGLDTMRIKVVGSDNGRYELAWLLPHPLWNLPTEFVSPSERTVIEAYFDRPGTFLLVHKWLEYRPYNDAETHVLGRITVLPDSVNTGYGDDFLLPDTSHHVRASIDSVRQYWNKPDVPPDKELLLTGKMGMSSAGEAEPDEAAKVAAHDVGTPISKGVEWRDHMALMNEVSNDKNMRWFIREIFPDSGKENHAIHWTFNKGDKVKIRIRGDGSVANSHPMPHPIHFHGQRFLVLAVNGRNSRNMAWKDTHLIGMQETVDILLDAGNPGTWMAHCHINEHAEAMMMFHFEVLE